MRLALLGLLRFGVPGQETVLGRVVASEVRCDLPTKTNKRPTSFRSNVPAAIDGYDRDHRAPFREAMDSGLCERPRQAILDSRGLWGFRLFGMGRPPPRTISRGYLTRNF